MNEWKPKKRIKSDFVRFLLSSAKVNVNKMKEKIIKEIGIGWEELRELPFDLNIFGMPLFQSTYLRKCRLNLEVQFSDLKVWC